ncbi:histidine kinase, partial [Streptomyces sp. RSD-27]
MRACGVLLGCATALLELAWFLVPGVALGPFLLWPRTRPDALGLLLGGARRLAALERGRRSAFFGDPFPAHYEASGPKILRYLAVRCYAGLLCATVLGLLGFGAVLAVLLVAGAARGRLGWSELLTQVLLGGVLLFLGLQGLRSLVVLDARIARACFGPSEHELLRARIEELAGSRAAVLRAVDSERRRIERDLHDG